MNTSDSNEEENSISEINLDSINDKDIQVLQKAAAIHRTTPKKGNSPKKKAKDADMTSLV